MNKTLSLISLIVVLTLSSCQNNAMARHTSSRKNQLDSNTAIEAKPQPIAVSRTIDLGAGYTLVLDTNGGHINAPASMIKTIDPATVKKTIDMGAGYTLVLDANGGHIVAPTNLAATQAQPIVIKKTDIGDGYWLVITTEGGQIVKEGTK